jgi:hypothetical protein
MPRSKSVRKIAGILFLLILCVHCQRFKKIKDAFSKKPEIAAASEVLKTAIPLGYAAACAMDAVAGDTAPGVGFIAGIGGYPGNGLLSISVSGSLPLPVGADTSGTIYVAGYWTSQDQAILSVFFTDLSVREGTFVLKNTATFPVQRDTSGFRIVYASEDVNSTADTSMTVTLTGQQMQFEWKKFEAVPPVDSAVGIDQNAWIIYVDTKGTPAIRTDDIYSVCGAGQYLAASVSGASVVQLVMIDVAYTPAKRLNPYSGRGILRDIDIEDNSLPELGTAVLWFHNKNDGRVDVPIATGVYIGSIGKSFALNLDK